MNPFQFEHTADALRAVLAGTGPADRVLSRYFRENPKLGQRDRGVVAETVYGVLRRYFFLSALIDPPVPRRLLAAYFAVAQGLNLRELSFLGEGELDAARRAKAARCGELPASARLDLPDWVIERLAAALPADELDALARGLTQAAPLDLRVNTVKATRDDVLTALHAEDRDAVATPYSPLGVRLKEKPALQYHPLFLEGKVEVQDEGSQLLGFLLSPKPREMTADFCAGAGGKTLLMGALMRSQGRVYAFDVSERRLQALGTRLKRSGLSNVTPARIANENDLKVKRLAGKISRVLVDAPCSGFGTLRRNPDLKLRQTAAGVAELVVKQRAILTSAARLVKPGGRLGYATCSLLPEENEAVAAEFAAAHPEFEPLHAGRLLAEQGIALDTGLYFKPTPHAHGMDAFFAAAYERRAD